MMAEYDAVVLVVEAKETVGGGMRTEELTLRGFRHDVCSSVHPLGLPSPFFRTLPLKQYELEWVFPSVELAHPLDDGTAVIIERSVQATADYLGMDRAAYFRLMTPLVEQYEKILAEFLGPLRVPRYPLVMARFGLLALQSAQGLANRRFRESRTRAVFAGLAAHAIRPLEHPATAAFGLMMGLLAHAVGWPLARGGSQHIANALTQHLCSLGGEIATNHEVHSLGDVPTAQAILLDVTPRQLVHIAGEQLPSRYKRQLEGYRYRPGVFKVDYALSEPIPWRARECTRAATVHMGGTLQEISHSERDMWEGRHSRYPFTLVVQPTLFDSTRAPAGKHRIGVLPRATRFCTGHDSGD